MYMFLKINIVVLYNNVCNFMYIVVYHCVYRIKKLYTPML